MVEIMYDTELEELVQLEKSEEWKNLISALSLPPQLETKAIPFVLMTRQIDRVYRVLCPNTTELIKYDATTIPTKVLDIIKLCQDRGYFECYEVWSNDNLDPIIVGKVNDKWSSPRYIIARWGDELKAFVTLQAEAYQKLILEKRNLYIRQRDEAISKLGNLDSLVEEYLAGTGNI